MVNSNVRSRKHAIEDSVQDRVEHLKRLARQHGLTTDDIDDCIILALSAKKQTPGHFWKFFGNLLRGLLLSTVILMCFMLVVYNHKPSKHFLEVLIFNTSYPVMRAVRLLSLPLARTVDLSRIYYSECTIPNPLYTGVISIDCYPCHSVESIETIEGTSRSLYGFGRPFILKDPKINPFSYGEMKTLYRTNQKIFSLAREDSIQSTNPFVHSAGDIFLEERKEEDIDQASFSLEWRAASAGSVRLIRNQCGKPSFVPPESEVFPEMFLIVESSSSHAHLLPHPAFLGYTWLSQAHGSREIVLSPVQQCKKNCTEISVVLEPGYVLFLDMRYWKLQSFPIGDGVSISCMGSFA